MLDPELLEGPADLRQMVPVDLARLRGVEVMAAAVGVEAHRQAVRRENLFQRLKGRGRSLFLDQKGRINRPGRVIERHDQVERGPSLDPRAVTQAVTRRRPGAASSPAADGARASCDAPPCAFAATPFHCRCSLSHV